MAINKNKDGQDPLRCISRSGELEVEEYLIAVWLKKNIILKKI